MTGAKQVQATFDCATPRAVAEFWKATLGYVDAPVRPEFDSWGAVDAALPVERQGSAWVCQNPDGVGSRLFFQPVPEGKTVKNRLHLDVRAGVGLTGDERSPRWGERGVPRHAGRRGQRVLPGLARGSWCGRPDMASQ